MMWRANPRMLQVPFALADATALTEAGYVGEDVENILLKLVQAADNDLQRAQTGIICLDEIDRIARAATTGRSLATFPGKGPAGPAEDFGGHHRVAATPRRAQAPPPGIHRARHTDVLIIVGGAFAGLDRIIENRIGATGIGFGASPPRARRRRRQRPGGPGTRRPRDPAAQGPGGPGHAPRSGQLRAHLVGRLPVVASLRPRTARPCARFSPNRATP